MRPILLLALALSLGSCEAPPPRAAEPRTAPESPEAPGGTVEVTGAAPRAYGGFPSVVFLEPETPIEVPEPEPAVLDQYGSAFTPKILVVRPGQLVELKNSEDVLHNVHIVASDTRETVLNIGTPVVGSYPHRFEREGAYEVTCNIHPYMAAWILVSAAPYFAIADNAGSFRIDAVAPGSYRVEVWNQDEARRRESRVAIEAPRSELNLVEPSDGSGGSD